MYESFSDLEDLEECVQSVESTIPTPINNDENFRYLLYFYSLNCSDSKSVLISSKLITFEDKFLT